nr:peptidylprolyl isomerase [candidate division Zixibacteria bacterium]
MKKLGIITLALLFLMPAVLAQDKKDQPTKDKKVSEYKKRQPDNPEIAIETDFGTMKLELFRDVAPIHVDSMLSLVKKGFYDGLIFHRIIDGFMIQGGDPKGNGTGGPGYTLPAEFNKIKHVEGSLSMARSQDPNSAGSQFFICLAPAPHLDGQYTNFGMLMDGFDTLHKIGKVETGAMDKPVKDVYIRKMYVIKDITPVKKATE